MGRALALTGWTAGAHVPAIQLSSLPLDEWHYIRHNETVRVRLRPERLKPSCGRLLPGMWSVVLVQTNG